MTRQESINWVEGNHTRREIATRAMCALIASRKKYNTKKQLCDNAIAFADMLMRRLTEIPTDAQQRSEAGQNINYNHTKL